MSLSRSLSLLGVTAEKETERQRERESLHWATRTRFVQKESNRLGRLNRLRLQNKKPKKGSPLKNDTRARLKPGKGAHAFVQLNRVD